MRQRRSPDYGIERYSETSRALVENVLVDMRLSDKDLKPQTAPQLEELLARVNLAIANPQQALNEALTQQSWALTGADVAEYERLIVPKLFDRKRLILELMRDQNRQQESEVLKEAVGAAVPDPVSRDKLIQVVQDQVTQRFEEEKSIQSQLVETNKAKQDMMLFEVGIRERKSAITRSWFERESVASIVGAIMLLGLGTALVVAMFTGTVPTEIITSAFLLILGYFFGQATSKRSKDSGS